MSKNNAIKTAVIFALFIISLLFLIRSALRDADIGIRGKKDTDAKVRQEVSAQPVETPERTVRIIYESAEEPEAVMPTAPSDELIEFVKACETFSPIPYYATDTEKESGYKTIGYGHLISKEEEYDSISEAQATELLKEDITRKIPLYLIERLEENGIVLSQCEFDALVSLCYNMGYSIMAIDVSPRFNEYLLSGTYTPEATRAHFLTYVRQNGEILDGLIKRREAEADMFSFGIYESLR